MERVDSADTGQLDVHQDQRGMLLSRKLHALFARACLDGSVALDLERIPHQLQILGVVFDNENQLIRHGAPGL